MAQTYRRGDPIEPAPAESGVGPDGAARPSGPIGRRVRARRAAARAARRAALGLAALLTLLVVAVLGLVFFVQTEAGRAQVERIALAQLRNLLEEDASLEIARLEGSFVRGVRLLGAVVSEGGEPALAVDTLEVRYNLLTLLRQTFSAGRVYASGVRVWARQDADGTWNLARILRPAPETERDTLEARQWTIRLADVTLTRAAAEVRFHHPSRDSVLVADPVELRLARFVSSRDGIEATVDSLAARLTPPVPDPVPVSIALAGELARDRADLRGLLVQSDRTNLRAAGRADWSGERLTFDADLTAEPLALADARQFAPIPLFGTATIRLQAQGTPEDVLARLEAVFEDHGSVRLAGAFSADPRAPVRYAAEGTVEALDLGALTGNPALAGELNAALAVDLAGPDLQTISGDVDLQVRASRLAERDLQRADLVGTFDRGRLRFTAGLALPGGRFLARGTATPFAETPAYDVAGEASGLDLAALTGNPEQTLRARRVDFRVNGRGTDPQTLMAEARLDATEAEAGPARVASARLAASLRAGFLRYDAALALADDGGVLTARGTARPLDEPIAFAVELGELQNLDLAALTGNPEQTSRLNGTFALNGRGTDPRTMTLDLAARLRDARYATLAIPAADLSANLRAGRLDLDAAADLAEAGTLALSGWARPFDPAIAYDLRGTTRSLNLAALTDNPALATDLSGSFAATGEGTDPQTLTADLRVDLDPSRLRQQPLTRAALVARLAAGDLDAAVDATTPEGRLAARALGRPFDELPTLRLRDGRFDHVDLALLLDTPNLTTRLSGSFEADVAGFDPALADATARLVLDPSTVNTARLEGGLATLSLRRGFARAEAQVAFAPRPGPARPGLGVAVTTPDAATGPRTRPARPDDLLPGPAARAADAPGLLVLGFQGRPFDATPTFTLEGYLEEADVLAFAPQAPGRSALNLQFAVSGEGADPATMTLRARVVGTESALPGARIDSLRADLRLAEGVLTADAFRLAADFADAEARGRIALFAPTATTDLTLRAAFRDAGPLNAYLDEPVVFERASLEGRATGPAGGPIAADATLLAERLVYGRYGSSRLELRLNAEYDATETVPFAGRVRAEFAFLATPALSLRDGSLTLTYLDDRLEAEGAVRVDDRRDVAFRGRVEQIEDAVEGLTNAVRLERLDLRVDGDRWELLQPAEIVLGADRYRVRNLLLFADDQQIAVDGVIDFRGEQTLVLTAENVAVDPFTDLVGYAGVGGRLTATLSLLGPAEAPEIEGSLRLAGITSGGEAVGALDATFAYADFRLALDALLTHVEGQTLTVEGSLPFAFRLDGEPAEPPPGAETDLAIRAEAFPVSWADPFLPPGTVTDLGGRLTADVRVGGTQADPQLEGFARLEEGRIMTEATGTAVFRDALLALTFVGNEARIETARARDGRGGTLQATGTITLPELSVGELDIAIVMDRFRVIETPTYRGLTLSATPAQGLRFSGTLTEPVLRGAVTLVSGDIYLTEELVGPDLEEVELSEAELQRLEATFGVRIAEADTARSQFFDNLDLQLGLAIERNVWLRSRRNPRFDIEFAGTLDVVKPPGAENELFGTIEVTRGRVTLPTLAGKAFTIGAIEGTFGRLEFNGPVPETLIQLRAGLEAPAPGGGTSATVYLAFEGRLAEGPELTLSAEPFMDTADIACVVATGRPCGDAFGSGAAEALAIGQLGAIIEGVAAENLGLDVVEVAQRPTGEIVVTFGTYVTDRTFAAVSQPVTESNAARGARQDRRTPEVTIEYEVLRWLQLRLESRNVGGTGGALLFRYEY